MTTIDVSKYEGHTPEAAWRWLRGHMTSRVVDTLPADLLGPSEDIDMAVLWADGDIVDFNSRQDKDLIADAPLILAAYKEKCAEVEVLFRRLDGDTRCPVCGGDTASDSSSIWCCGRDPSVEEGYDACGWRLERNKP